MKANTPDEVAGFLISSYKDKSLTLLTGSELVNTWKKKIDMNSQGPVILISSETISDFAL